MAERTGEGTGQASVEGAGHRRDRTDTGMERLSAERREVRNKNGKNVTLVLTTD